jgi:hypothetical protein
MTVRSGDVPGTILSRRSRRLAGITLALPAFLLAGLLVLPGAATAGDPTPPPPVFESASGFVEPGETISTQDGPLNAADPFAVDLKNVGNQTLFVTIEEEPCDGTQEDPLCSEPRVGGVAGDFMFEPSDGGSLSASSSAAPVVLARLLYDESLLDGVKGFKIFWQETPGGPVLRLPRCDDGLKTECFKGKKLANGDQIVRIPLSQDPKFTRG